MNTKEIMQAREVNWSTYQKAISTLEKGYDHEAFEAFTMALKNMHTFDKLHNEDSHGYSHNSHTMAPMADVPAPVDYVHGSNVDEGIQGMLALFVEYSNAKDGYRKHKTDTNKHAMLEPLEKMLKMHQDVMMSVVSCTDCEEERALIRKFMEKMRELKHV